MTLIWQNLMCDMRCPRQPGDPLRPSRTEAFRSPFEADYDRVIFSTPFRRLARKTQVHPLAMNDHVHTRLTHSLEVANVGRSLGKRLVHFLKARGELPDGRSENDPVMCLQAACLAHDVGNPPFGHAGEYAIREWVKAHAQEVFGGHVGMIAPGIRRDLELFEGNAQGFRIAARADNPQPGYLRLTFATLGAMIKYPWDSSDPRALAKGKYNAFSTEKWVFDLMAEALGLVRGGTVVRHPLSFLSEAADDICYRVLDLEDAVEMGILSPSRVREIFVKLVPDAAPAEPQGVLRGRAIQRLIDETWRVFADDYAAIMEGDRHADLKSDLDPAASAVITEIKLLYEQIFAERSKVAAELGAYKALGRIIKALCFSTQQLQVTRNFESTEFLARRTLELAWGKEYATENQAQPYEWWLHQAIDFVSSLTDNYARQLSREIEGT